MKCKNCGYQLEQLGDGDWIHVESQRISCEGIPEEFMGQDDLGAEPVEIYRTTYLIEVFSEGPFLPLQGDNDPFDLETINYAITEGDCIGDVTRQDSTIVPADEVGGHLERIGNDGSFFDGF